MTFQFAGGRPNRESSLQCGAAHPFVIFFFCFFFFRFFRGLLYFTPKKCGLNNRLNIQREKKILEKKTQKI
jgi:hypothetical protein